MKKNQIEKIEIKRSNDIRGNASKIWSTEFMKELGYSFKVDEIFCSTSQKDVIRGMHFQREEKAQSKIVTVLQGEIVDVIIDLRRDSAEFGEIKEYVISDKSEFAIYIPKGFAHGFKVIKDNTMLLYAIEGKQEKDSEMGIRWNSFGYEWNVKNPIMNDRDKEFPTYEDVIKKVERI